MGHKVAEKLHDTQYNTVFDREQLLPFWIFCKFHGREPCKMQNRRRCRSWQLRLLFVSWRSGYFYMFKIIGTIARDNKVKTLLFSGCLPAAQRWFVPGTGLYSTVRERVQGICLIFNYACTVTDRTLYLFISLAVITDLFLNFSITATPRTNHLSLASTMFTPMRHNFFSLNEYIL